TATTDIYTLSLHDALPIYGAGVRDPADHVGDRQTEAERGNGRHAGAPDRTTGIGGSGERVRGQREPSPSGHVPFAFGSADSAVAGTRWPLARASASVAEPGLPHPGIRVRHGLSGGAGRHGRRPLSYGPVHASHGEPFG